MTEGRADRPLQAFVAGDECLGSDVVFGAKDSLIAEFERREHTQPLVGAMIARPHRYLRFDLVLAGAKDAAG